MYLRSGGRASVIPPIVVSRAATTEREPWPRRSFLKGAMVTTTLLVPTSASDQLSRPTPEVVDGTGASSPAALRLGRKPAQRHTTEWEGT